MTILSKLRTPFRYSYSNAVLLLIVANAAVYLLFKFFPYYKDYFGLSFFGVMHKKMYWQPFTYMFIHADFMHFLFNMLGLLFFGVSVERSLGTKEFLLLYFFVGVFSGLFSVGIYYVSALWQIHNGFYPTMLLVNLIGASGAIYGILFSFAVIFPRARIFIYGIIPVPAPLLVAGYALIEVVSNFLGNSNVAHMTHLAGFGFAWVYFAIRMGVNPIKVWRNTFYD